MWVNYFSIIYLFYLWGVRGQDIETVADRIMKKIASAFEKSVQRAGNTCGLPKIHNVMKNLTLREGDTARFSCNVDMKCMVSYIQWYHQEFDDNSTSTLLRTGADMGDPYSFIIKDVSYSDEGFYSCVAGNTLGETVSSAFLQISTATIHTLDIWSGLSVVSILWVRRVLYPIL